MSDKTKIQWADATFNPWIGCTKVSAGCAFCYAENTTRARVLRSQGQETWGKGAQRSRTSAATWRKPIIWNAAIDQKIHLREECLEGDIAIPRLKVFPSLCDWLDEEVPIEWLADFLKLIHDTPHLDWLLLTKRPENFFGRMEKASNVQEGARGTFEWLDGWWDDGDFPENVWLGASVENQAMADKRIPELLKIPAKVRFLSAEPLLGPTDLEDVLLPSLKDVQAVYRGENPEWPKIHWIIFGGESGPKARPCNVEWIRDGVKQCRACGVKAFVKQLGSKPCCTHSWDGEQSANCTECFPNPIRDSKGGDMAEWPEDLRVREFPDSILPRIRPDKTGY